MWILPWEGPSGANKDVKTAWSASALEAGEKCQEAERRLLQAPPLGRRFGPWGTQVRTDVSVSKGSPVKGWESSQIPFPNPIALRKEKVSSIKIS